MYYLQKSSLKPMAHRFKGLKDTMEGWVHPKVQALLQRPSWEQRTPEWYERRKTLMTASDCAGALGIPAFHGQTGDIRANLIKSKCNPNGFKGNHMTRHGQLNEDQVRDRACAILGLKALDFGLLVHEELDWLGASPDGITTTGAMIEIKCPYKRPIVPHEMPHHYYPQVQVQLEVCDLELAYFVEWAPEYLTSDGKEVLSILPIERDRNWFAKHRDALHSFYLDLIEARRTYVPPPPPPPPSCLIVDDLYADLA
jgi:putative phage-type endonuclease